MIPLAILDDYQRIALRLADWSRIAERCAIDVFDRPFTSLDAAAAALSCYQVICTMRERTAFPRALLERLPRLRLISITGSVNRTLDMVAATERGVLVCNTRRQGGGEYATPELAWGLVLALFRNIAVEAAVMRQGGWQTTLGRSLNGKTLGILGLGRTGSRIAHYGRAFGMEVVAWSPNLTPERAAAAGAVLVSREDLFGRSDVVSIHMVLGETTRGIVDAGLIRLMKPTAYLVNTSRGALVDQTALIGALRERRIAGAALDVFDEEPLPDGHDLRGLDNTILTPHLGYVVEEKFVAFYEETVENVEAFLAGFPVRLLNPDAIR